MGLVCLNLFRILKLIFEISMKFTEISSESNAEQSHAPLWVWAWLSAESENRKGFWARRHASGESPAGEGSRGGTRVGDGEIHSLESRAGAARPTAADTNPPCPWGGGVAARPRATRVAPCGALCACSRLPPSQGAPHAAHVAPRSALGARSRAARCPPPPSRGCCARQTPPLCAASASQLALCKWGRGTVGR